MKRLLPFLAVTAMLVSCWPSLAPAQTANAIVQPFTLTAVGQRLPPITLTGQMQNCGVVVYNSGGGFTLVPQVASDGIVANVINPTPTWVTASTINSGSISATGSFNGNVSGQGITTFSGALTALTSGTISGVYGCGSSTGTLAATISGIVTTACATPACNVAIVAPTDAAGEVLSTLNGEAPYVQTTSSAMPQATALPAAAFGYSFNASAGKWYPIGTSSTIGGAPTTNAGVGVVVCNAGTTLCAVPVALPTASPGVAGPGTPLSVGAYTACENTSGVINVTPGNFIANQCDTAGRLLVNPQTLPTASAAPATIATSAPALNTTSQQYIISGGVAYARSSAPSPAPSGLPALGYNTAGAAAPIICTKTAGGNGTTDGNVQIIALSGTTHVYVCEADLSVVASAGGILHFLSGTGSACATPVNTGPGVSFGVTTTGVALATGNGVGIVFDGGAGNELCIGGTGTTTFYTYHVIYEQF